MSTFASGRWLRLRCRWQVWLSTFVWQWLSTCRSWDIEHWISQKLNSSHPQIFWCWHGAQAARAPKLPLLARLAHGYPQGRIYKVLSKNEMCAVRLFTSKTNSTLYFTECQFTSLKQNMTRTGLNLETICEIEFLLSLQSPQNSGSLKSP